MLCRGSYRNRIGGEQNLDHEENALLLHPFTKPDQFARFANHHLPEPGR